MRHAASVNQIFSADVFFIGDVSIGVEDSAIIFEELLGDAGCIFDVFLTVGGAQQNIESVAIGEIGTLLALHSHVAQIVVDGLADGGLGRDLGLGFRSGDETFADGVYLNRLAAGLGDCVLAGDRDAAAPAAFAPLDLVRAFGVDFDLAIDANPVLESAIGFRQQQGQSARQRLL
jgi:hypothetical protein